MKKKIIIFTSLGGGGHTTTAQALSDYLSDTYDIQISCIFNTILGKIDPVKMVAFGKLSGEGGYNFFATRGFYNTLNWIHKIGSWYMRQRTKTITKLILRFLKQEKPDMVISVIPFVNGDILRAAQTLDIPFLLIPTDLDATTFLSGIHNPQYKKFLLVQAFNDPKIKKITSLAAISDKQITITGHPLRIKFATPADVTLIKKKFNIPDNKPVALVLLGSCGSTTMYQVAKLLAQVSQPLHVLFCLGRHTKIYKKIEQIPLPPHISLSFAGFTDKIADLMYCADFFITKSGSLSVIESIYMELPMILDATKPLIKWEQFNHPFVVQHQFGVQMKNYNELPQIVEKFLLNKSYYQQMKTKLKTFEKKDGCQEIKKLVVAILSY